MRMCEALVRVDASVFILEVIKCALILCIFRVVLETKCGERLMSGMFLLFDFKGSRGYRNTLKKTSSRKITNIEKRKLVQALWLLNINY